MSKEKSGIDLYENTDEAFDITFVERPLNPCEKESNQKKHSGSVDEHFCAAYRHYGQHMEPHKKVWVQFHLAGEVDDADVAAVPYDPKTRNPFVFKVFLLVLISFTITIAYNIIANKTPAIYEFMVTDTGKKITGGCAMCLFGVHMVTMFYTRSYYPPLSWVILFVTVVLYCEITSFFTILSATEHVIYAVASTTVVVLLILCLSCTSWDFTRYWTFVMVGAAAFCAASIVITTGMKIMKTKFEPLTFGITITAVFVHSIVLLLTLQAILGGKTVEMPEDLYVIAAYNVYTSIVTIFIKLLRIIRTVADR